jgi:hypothetical protein
MKNITFSAKEDKIERARQYARTQNTTLIALFREWLDGLAERENRAEEYRALMDQLRHVNAGRKFTREEMNERR